MSWGSRVRLFALHAVLVATAVQGLAPDASSLASPAALEWLGAAMAPDDPDARRGRLPGSDRPDSPDARQDAPAVRVAILAESMVGTASHRRLAGWCVHLLATAGSSRPLVETDARPRGPVPGPAAAATDLIACRCRLSC